MDTEATLEEYQMQLEQVELVLKSDPENDEMLKLKADLEEVIALTKELLNEERGEGSQAKRFKSGAEAEAEKWKGGDKCMAIWRVDGRYYPATVEKILDDGMCTVIFDGYTTSEITQVGQLTARTKNEGTLADANTLSTSKNQTSAVGHKKSYTKKELELKIREAKKRKKEKLAAKIKAQEEISEKEKNKWKSFNSKLQTKTWKGVVKKNRYETPENHENKIGVGTNSAANRVITPNGTILPTNTSSAAQSSTRHVTKSFKTSTFK